MPIPDSLSAFDNDCWYENDLFSFHCKVIREQGSLHVKRLANRRERGKGLGLAETPGM